MQRIIGLLPLIFTMCLPLPVIAAEKLPAGCIAITPKEMNLRDAKKYCASKGGRLPLIGGKNSLASVPKGTSIDGFGAMGAKWPSGLPSDYYWTGTANADGPGLSWIVYHDDGYVNSSTPDGQNFQYRVVCVP